MPSNDLTAKHHSGAPAPPQKSCCSGKVKIIPNPSTDQESKSSKRKQRGSPSPTPPPSKQANHGPRTHSQSLPPIKLPPIFTPPTSLSSTTHINPLPSSASPFPSFPTIPPLSSIAAIAGSGCCCGFRCTCPGCVEHRGAEYASRDHEDCPDGCGTCVDWDNEAGVELPKAHSYHSTDVHTVLSSDTAGSSSSAISNLDVYGEKRLAAGSSKSILSTSSTSTNFIDAYFSQARTPISPSVASGSPRATEKQKEDEPAPQKSSTNEKNKKSSCCCGDADEGDDEDIEAKSDLDDAKTIVKAH
ncbi:hypothetical protein K474DRAFT_1659529 [Panus rudis PR-1116 ss-1]|nr:hypothetical protein K474DRAFT_1659529 [Panus rudis PR-1116 ss-1]